MKGLCILFTTQAIQSMNSYFYGKDENIPETRRKSSDISFLTKFTKNDSIQGFCHEYSNRLFSEKLSFQKLFVKTGNKLCI